MNYHLAVTAGQFAMVFVLLAATYHILHLLLNSFKRGGMPARHLETAVFFARISHPYVSSLISLAAAYHVFVMWMTHPLNFKMGSGVLGSFAVIVMANSGWLVKLGPRLGWPRRVHRKGMYFLLAVLVVHLLL